MRMETRFVGNGNTWVANGHYRGWQVTCANCGVVKTVTSHHGSSLPPDAIVRTLNKSGWLIGRKPEEDLCAGCRKKQKPAPIKPVVFTFTNQSEYFEQLRHFLNLAKKAIEAKQHSKAIGFLDDVREQLMPEVAFRIFQRSVEPKPPDGLAEAKKPEPEVKKPKPEPPESDDDYQKWLAELTAQDAGK